MKGMSIKQAKRIREKKGISDTKLCKVRVKKGYSQSQLSAVSNVAIRTIQCYEQRNRNISSARLDTLCDLCIALNCKIEDIIEDKELIAKYRLVK